MGEPQEANAAASPGTKSFAPPGDLHGPATQPGTAAKPTLRRAPPAVIERATSRRSAAGHAPDRHPLLPRGEGGVVEHSVVWARP